MELSINAQFQWLPDKRQNVDPTTVNHISGKRWFDRVNGNTYHNTTLHLKDGKTIESGMLYGYDNQFYSTALDMMGLEYRWERLLTEEYGITISVADVQRKRDL